MRTFFDYQTFSLQAYGGISRYYTELITGINKTEDNEAYLPLLVSDNIHLAEAGIAPGLSLRRYGFYKKVQIMYRLNQLYTVAKLKSKEFDVFHPTYYDPYFLPYLPKKPFVVTFLDMIQEKFSSQFPDLDDNGVTFARKKIVAERADRIIAISESTKKDIVEYLHVDPAKIEVIYLGSSFEVATKVPVEGSKKPYLLYVGRRERYKNFAGMMVAISAVLIKHDVELVCAGGGAFSKEEQEFLKAQGVSNLVRQEPIDDEKLKKMYQHAVGFIFPSLYEGFGIPVLEAFACGCPCVLTNQSSLPEVAGDAALYADPAVPESMALCVDRLITDQVLREELTRRGFERLKQFSWKNTVTRTISLYHQLV
ncbi:glycosyltransferase family 1 protein [Spirosoma luteolum]